MYTLALKQNAYYLGRMVLMIILWLKGSRVVHLQCLMLSFCCKLTIAQRENSRGKDLQELAILVTDSRRKYWSSVVSSLCMNAYL